MDRTAQDEFLQQQVEVLTQVLREEKEALETWKSHESLPKDVLDGIQISLSKIEAALNL